MTRLIYQGSTRSQSNLKWKIPESERMLIWPSVDKKCTQVLQAHIPYAEVVILDLGRDHFLISILTVDRLNVGGQGEFYGDQIQSFRAAFRKAIRDWAKSYMEHSKDVVARGLALV